MRNDGVKYDKFFSFLMVCLVGIFVFLGVLCLVVVKVWVFIVIVF